LNFSRQTEDAFNFYKTVFGREFKEGGIRRFKDMPASSDAPTIKKEDMDLVMHVELEILGGHVLMGTDASESMGFKVILGNNMHINLEPDTRTETERLFKALSAGGEVTMELTEMFWGAYFGSCTDKFGLQWMFNCAQK
jgi:PhnB protein